MEPAGHVEGDSGHHEWKQLATWKGIVCKLEGDSWRYIVRDSVNCIGTNGN